MDDFMTPKQRQRTLYFGAGVAAAAAAIVLFLLVQFISGLGGPKTPAPSTVPSSSPTASIDISANTALRLEVTGLQVLADPLGTPPFFEMANGRVITLDIPSKELSGKPAKMTAYGISATAASSLIADARSAGLEGEAFLADPNDYLPISYVLTLVTGGQVTGRITLNGVVNPGESGPESARRASLWALVERLLDPVTALDLRDGTAYLPERYTVRASALPPEALSEGEPDIPTWSFGLPADWTGGCKTFTGTELAPIVEALAKESFGRTWLDAGGAPWMLVGRPLTPTEADPCQ